MIRYCLFFILVLIPGITSRYVTGQCIPDTTCVDTLEPGQICPDSLPPGIVNELYYSEVTILPPATARIGDANLIIIKIRIDTIQNLPPGISYELSAEEMYPDTLYCAALEGTPETPGIYPLRILVTPTVNVLGFPVQGDQQVDSTSVVMTIQAADSRDDITGEGIKILECTPNPFSGSCRIGILSMTPSDAYHRKYNMLGKLVYSEKKYAASGDAYFTFSGVDLIPGMYIYSVTSQGNALTRRLIKLK